MKLFSYILFLSSTKSLVNNFIPKIRGYSAMNLHKVVSKLEKFAPLKAAGNWDNVGLLVEPSNPKKIETILLTNDMTEDVVDESINLNSNLIISYHPPIFSTLKRLTQSKWKERIIIKCIENKIAVFSPHTSWDAVLGGVNDWLIFPFLEFSSNPVDIIEKIDTPSILYNLRIPLPGESVGIKINDIAKSHNIEGVTFTNCWESVISETVILKFLQDVKNIFGINKNQISIIECKSMIQQSSGYGRKLVLNKSITFKSASELLKSHLKLECLRLAVGKNIDTDGLLIDSIAVCAGSGGSILKNVKADLLITGEMSHHEILEHVENGRSVILCEHSNSERGFLQIFQDKLENDILKDCNVQVIVSKIDQDPIKIV